MRSEDRPIHRLYRLLGRQEEASAASHTKLPSVKTEKQTSGYQAYTHDPELGYTSTAQRREYGPRTYFGLALLVAYGLFLLHTRRAMAYTAHRNKIVTRPVAVILVTVGVADLVRHLNQTTCSGLS